MLSDAQTELLDDLYCRYSLVQLPETEILKSVSFILHDNRKLLEAASEILGEDQHSGGVKMFVSTSCGRKCWKIRGSHDKDYTCLTSYCSCPSFFLQSKQCDGRVYCKHLLAIKLATMLNLVEVESVSDEKFVEVMCQETSTSSVLSSKPYRSWRK